MWGRENCEWKEVRRCGLQGGIIEVVFSTELSVTLLPLFTFKTAWQLLTSASGRFCACIDPSLHPSRRVHSLAPPPLLLRPSHSYWPRPQSTTGRPDTGRRRRNRLNGTNRELLPSNLNEFWWSPVDTFLRIDRGITDLLFLLILFLIFSCPYPCILKISPTLSFTPLLCPLSCLPDSTHPAMSPTPLPLLFHYLYTSLSLALIPVLLILSVHVTVETRDNGSFLFLIYSNPRCNLCTKLHRCSAAIMRTLQYCKNVARLLFLHFHNREVGLSLHPNYWCKTLSDLMSQSGVCLIFGGPVKD